MYRRFDEIEGLRALLAWWVVFSHMLGGAGYQANALVWPFNIFRNGSLAVNGFMIVSGFVITHLILGRRESYGVYLGRRFLRLFPLFIISCVIAIVVQEWIGIASSDYDRDRWPLYLAINATMLHGMIPDEVLHRASRSIVNPGWSISLEWQFYLVAPLFMWIWYKGGRVLKLCAVVPIFLIIAYGLLNRKSLPWSYPHASLLLFSIHYFLIGMASYHVFSNMGEAKVRISSVGCVLAGLLTYAVSRNYAVSIWVGFFCLLISRDDSGVLRRVLSFRPLKHLGGISFSTYMIHYVVVSVVATTMARRGLEKQTISFLLIEMAIVVPITYIVSFVLYKCVEAPFINMGKKRLVKAPQEGS